MKKNNSGITLVSLVITIIVLLILSSIAVYSGVSTIRSTRLTKFTTELKMMQQKVNELYDCYTNNKSVTVNGTEYVGSDIQNIGQNPEGIFNTNRLEEIFSEDGSGITDRTGYMYYDTETITALGLDNMEYEFFVNVAKRSVVSIEGFNDYGKMYYTLDQVPNGVYNVEYNPTVGVPTFDASYEKIGDNQWRITISNIQYNGYITKWDVKYQIEGQTNWNTSEDLSFVVNKNGIYKIKIVKETIESLEQTIKVGFGEKTYTYQDKNGDEATIPKGFEVSEDKNEQTIDDGLVIKDEKGNEFVWIPVEPIVDFSDEFDYRKKYIKGEDVEYAEYYDVNTVLYQNYSNEVLGTVLKTVSEKFNSGEIPNTSEEIAKLREMYIETGEETYMSTFSFAIYKYITEGLGMTLDSPNDFATQEIMTVIEQSANQIANYYPIPEVSSKEEEEMWIENMVSTEGIPIHECTDFDIVLYSLYNPIGEEKTSQREKMYESVEKYKGFYVARYERGENAISQKDQIPLFSDQSSVEQLKDLVNLYPENSNEYGVASTGIYGAQWNAIIEFLGDVNNSNTGEKYIYNSEGMANYPFSTGEDNTTLTKQDLEKVKTGKYQVKNIYDLAGNVAEARLTQYGVEESQSSYICSGGLATVQNTYKTTHYKNEIFDNEAYMSKENKVNFRVTLYIKN